MNLAFIAKTKNSIQFFHVLNIIDMILSKTKMLAKQNNIENNILKLLALITIICEFGQNFWALDKGFFSSINSDEGWLMYLFDNQIKDVVTRPHIILGCFSFLSDIYVNRLICWLLHLLSVAIFAYSFSTWLKVKIQCKSSFIVAFGLACLPALNIHGCSSLYYTSLIHIITLFSLSVLFLALTFGKPRYYLSCGFIIAFLFPVKITCLSILPLILMEVYIYSSLRSVLWCLCGFVISLCLYVFVIESPSAVYDWLLSGTENTVNAGNDRYGHGLMFLLRWLYDTVLYCFGWFLLAYIIGWMPKSFHKISFLREHRNVRYCCMVFFLMFTARFFWWYVSPQVPLHIESEMLKYTIWVFVMLMLLHCYVLHKGKYLIVLMLLLLTPICICFGTDINFITSHSPRYICVILCAIPLLPRNYLTFFRRCTILLFVFALSIFAFRLPNMRMWFGEEYKQQDIPIASIGINQRIKVDSDYLHCVEFVRDNVPHDAPIICSFKNWPTIWLLGLKSLDSNFHFVSAQRKLDKMRPELQKGNSVFVLYRERDADWVDFVEMLQNDYDIVTKPYREYRLAIVQPYWKEKRCENAYGSQTWNCCELQR